MPAYIGMGAPYENMAIFDGFRRALQKIGTATFLLLLICYRIRFHDRLITVGYVNF